MKPGDLIQHIDGDIGIVLSTQDRRGWPVVDGFPYEVWFGGDAKSYWFKIEALKVVNDPTNNVPGVCKMP